MRNVALNQINTKLKSIPDNFVKDIIEYLDYLSFKANTGDWATELTAKELQLVKRGTKDLKNGAVFSHHEATAKINAHIKQKHK